MTIELVTRAEGRRFSATEKLEIVREMLVPGASVGMVAQRPGLSTRLLYTWRKRALAGAMAGFVPVEVDVGDRPALGAPASPVGAPPATVCAPGRRHDADRAGSIEVALPNGWRVRWAAMSTPARCAACSRFSTASAADAVAGGGH